MKKTEKYLYTFLCLLAVLFIYIPDSESEDIEDPLFRYEIADVKLGGLLYDNWYELKRVEPQENHPLYPENGIINGSRTWRCKECHGWDYMGKDGSYGRGFHYTGIKGIYNARNKIPEEIYNALTDKELNHDFTEFLRLSVSDIWALVKFIRVGIVNTEIIISPQGIVNGDLVNGKDLYVKHCAECHGMDGNKIEFREHLEGIHGMGWESISDPPETLHKIRWGHPGSDMPSAIIDLELTFEDTIDILSYCQTLYP